MPTCAFKRLLFYGSCWLIPGDYEEQLGGNLPTGRPSCGKHFDRLDPSGQEAWTCQSR